MTVTRLCYRSTPNFADMTGTLDEEIDRLLLTARRNNARDGVTGALLLAGTTYFQILEGPQEAVTYTFRRIARDRRHMDLTLIDERDDTARLVPGRSLYFADTMDAYDGVLASLILPIANAPELVSYEDLASLVMFSANRAARDTPMLDVMSA
ncbi:BLUF domain-containing protein [Stappia sp.]|uniref:BLUF domain-containing protein n=1 Tax=Stappia sp. TaxID=1870903 RepID=UPI0032D99E51